MITILKQILSFMELQDAEVTIDDEHRKVSFVIDDEVVRTQSSILISAFDHIVNLLAKKEGKPSYIVDLNYYRKERERLITELARAAARKAMLTKSEVELPPMNAYERRLVHMEITTHPELKTESVGMGKERKVVIKRL